MIIVSLLFLDEAIIIIISILEPHFPLPRVGLHSNITEPRHEKTYLQGLRPVKTLEILAIASRDIILSKQQTIKALIRMRGCTGWSTHLLFAYGKSRFSHDVAHFWGYSLINRGNIKHFEVIAQTGMSNQCRPRSSSLIKMYIILLISTLFAIQSPSFGLFTPWLKHIVRILG